MHLFFLTILALLFLQITAERPRSSPTSVRTRRSLSSSALLNHHDALKQPHSEHSVRIQHTASMPAAHSSTHGHLLQSQSANSLSVKLSCDSFEKIHNQIRESKMLVTRDHHIPKDAMRNYLIKIRNIEQETQSFHVFCNQVHKAELKVISEQMAQNLYENSIGLSKKMDKLYKWINSQLPKKGTMTDFRHNREVAKKACQRFEHVIELLVEADEKAKKLSPKVAFEKEQKTALVAKFKSVAQEKGKWDQICEQVNFGGKIENHLAKQIDEDATKLMIEAQRIYDAIERKHYHPQNKFRKKSELQSITEQKKSGFHNTFHKLKTHERQNMKRDIRDWNQHQENMRKYGDENFTSEMAEVVKRTKPAKSYPKLRDLQSQSDQVESVDQIRNVNEANRDRHLAMLSQIDENEEEDENRPIHHVQVHNSARDQDLYPPLGRIAAPAA